MVQKSSQQRILEVFFIEPTTIHFIKEISKKIKLAHTSVRKNIKDLYKEKLLIKKESKPFNGYIANRENEEFLLLKKLYNLESLSGLTKDIVKKIHPKAIVLFGSYLRGEDREDSDIDLFILSDANDELNLKSYEKKLNRKINLMISKKLDNLDGYLIKKIRNGTLLHGEIE